MGVFQKVKDYLLSDSKPQQDILTNKEIILEDNVKTIENSYNYKDDTFNYIADPNNLSNYIKIHNYDGVNHYAEVYINDRKVNFIDQANSGKTFAKDILESFYERTEMNKENCLTKYNQEEFETLHIDLDKLENQKSLFGREQMEKYLEKNNISEELRNSHKFINLVNASMRLESTCYQLEDFYKEDFHDGTSPEEIYEFEKMHNLDEQKEIRKEFLNMQDQAYDNKEKYNFLLNLVNKQINKMVGEDIERVDEQFDDIQQFKTNKELKFEDGSIIKPGTYFMIEGLSSDVGDNFNYEIHFESREDDIYNRENGTGEGYYLTESELIKNSMIIKHENEIKKEDTFSLDKWKEIINNKQDKNNYNYSDNKKDKEVYQNKEYKSIYEYPDNYVLINKFGIKEFEVLEKVERTLTALRISELDIKPIVGNFDFKHLSNIHKHIFRDIYDWAGKPRVEEISKGNTDFAPSRFAVEGLEDTVFKNIRKDNYLRGLPLDKLSEKLANYYSELNFAHPFREGNGRTQREFIKELTAKNGYKLGWDLIDKDKLLEATIEATNSLKYDKLSKLLEDGIVNKEFNKDMIKAFERTVDLER